MDNFSLEHNAIDAIINAHLSDTDMSQRPSMLTIVRPVWNAVVDAIYPATFVDAAFDYIFPPTHTKLHITKKMLAQPVATIHWNDSNARSTFSHMPPPMPTTQGGTHPLAAASRSASDMFINEYISTLGYSVYSVSPSTKDQRRGFSGTRVAYHFKDLNQEFQCDLVQANHVFKLVDVDYYIDMNCLLATGYPVMLYTMLPLTAGETVDNVSYHFEPRGDEDYLVSNFSGGSSYEHPLWDYCSDNVTVPVPSDWKYYCQNILNLTFVNKCTHFPNQMTDWRYFMDKRPVTFQTYKIERRRVNATHQIVLLSPVRRFTLTYNEHLQNTLPHARGLKRLKVINRDSQHVVFNITKDKIPQVSIGVIGIPLSITVPMSVLHFLTLRSRDPKHPISLAAIGTTLKSNDVEVPASLAGVVSSYLNSLLAIETGRFTPPWIDASVSSCVHYEPVSHTPGDVKPRSPNLFMKPLLLNQTYLPIPSKSSEMLAISQRILKVKPGDLKVKPFFKICVQEFVKYVFPKPHILSPEDLIALLARQSRPSQQRIIDGVLDDYHMAPDDREVLEIFLKNETARKLKDPRIITMMPPALKVRYSMAMYAFTDYLHANCEWYCPGSTPLEIANKVSKVCIDSIDTGVDLTDFTRMDGSISEPLRYFDKALLSRGFTPESVEGVLEDFGRTYARIARSKLGTKVEEGTHQGSGSPDTTPAQTTRNKFCRYYSMRRAGFDADYSYKVAGLFSGDDGLGKNHLKAEDQVKYAAELGLILEANISPPNGPVDFLSRHYHPSVWRGGTENICSYQRQLAKLHVSFLPPTVSAHDCALSKARMLALTDPNTPVIGPWALKICSLHPNSSKQVGEERQYERSLRLSEYSVCTDTYWMTTHILQDKNMSYDWIEHLEKQIEEAECLDDLLNLNTMFDGVDPAPPTTVSCVAGDDILEVPSAPPIEVLYKNTPSIQQAKAIVLTPQTKPANTQKPPQIRFGTFNYLANDPPYIPTIHVPAVNGKSARASKATSLAHTPPVASEPATTKQPKKSRRGKRGKNKPQPTATGSA